ncbi:MAG TPA: phosphatase PAP2 family protein, partial [Stenomitos sp.]
GVLSHTGFVIAAPLLLGVVSNPEGVTAPILVLASEGLAYGAEAAIKPLFNRPRPYMTYPDLKTPNGKMEDDPLSFPSGHAAVSFAAATVLADYNPKLAWPAYGIAALVSYSRIYNGLHYPSDILAGALLGIGVGKFTRWGLDQINGRYGFPMLSAQPTANLNDGFMLGFRKEF